MSALPPKADIRRSHWITSSTRAGRCRRLIPKWLHLRCAAARPVFVKVIISDRRSQQMSSGLQFDEEISRKVESLYMTPDVVAQRHQVLKALALRDGERVLDIGSGPGLLAYDMAASVGRNGRVCGIDISEDMLTMSRKRCADQPWTEFQRADATNLPYPDDSFDAAASTQVYEYVVDIPAALAELYRVV